MYEGYKASVNATLGFNCELEMLERRLWICGCFRVAWSMRLRRLSRFWPSFSYMLSCYVCTSAESGFSSGS